MCMSKVGVRVFGVSAQRARKNAILKSVDVRHCILVDCILFILKELVGGCVAEIWRRAPKINRFLAAGTPLGMMGFCIGWLVMTGHYEGIYRDLAPHAEMYARIVVLICVYIVVIITRWGRGGGRRVGGGILFRRGWSCVRHHGDLR